MSALRCLRNFVIGGVTGGAALYMSSSSNTYERGRTMVKMDFYSPPTEEELTKYREVITAQPGFVESTLYKANGADYVMVEFWDHSLAYREACEALRAESISLNPIKTAVTEVDSVKLPGVVDFYTQLNAKK